MENRIPELIVCAGFPASGKSHWAKRQNGYRVHSSDEIRKELFGSEMVQENPGLVFQILHKRIREDLKAGRFCIYDATNLSAKRRAANLKQFMHIPCRKICVLFVVPLEVLKDRNRKRERSVPEYVYDRYLKTWTPPLYEEGWDEIRVIWNCEGA